MLSFTSSNFYAAERQFRYPIEYGPGKKDTATITCSGAGAVIVSKNKTKVKIESATIGRVCDVNWSDPNNMGCVMAYAAYDTIINHLRNTKTNLNDYSIIITGDLSKVGSKVLEELFLQSDNPFKNHLDAGCMIYDEKTQEDVYAGGSGCACLPLVGYTLILNRLIDKTYSRVLFVGTGCLHSKESNAKKQTIPVIAHAVEFRRV